MVPIGGVRQVCILRNGGNSGVSGPNEPSPQRPIPPNFPHPPGLSHLGLVPFLCLLQVLRRDALILRAYVSQRRCQLRLHGRLHLYLLHLLVLHAHLQVSQLLPPRATRRRVRSADPTRMAQFTHRKEQKHLNQQKRAPGSAALTELHTLRTVRTEPVARLPGAAPPLATRRRRGGGKPPVGCVYPANVAWLPQGNSSAPPAKLPQSLPPSSNATTSNLLSLP